MTAPAKPVKAAKKSARKSGGLSGGASGGLPKALKEKKVAANARAAHPGNCPRCGSTVLIGLDDDRCALNARVDTAPVDLLAEMIGILSGRRSYDLIAGDLHRRDDFRACLESRWPVHLEHRCT